jgi:Glucodextranase, domain B
LLGGVSIAIAGASLQDQRVREVHTASPSASQAPALTLTMAPPATADKRAPVISVTEPAAGATIYTSSVTLRGTTEAGADIDVLDEASNEHLPAQVDPDGRFAADIPLQVGHNWLTLKSTDAGGNVGRDRVDIVRTASAASITLSIAPTGIDLASLPQRLHLSASITDDLGAPADGVQVIFSVSPPRAPTITYATTAVHGNAGWANVVIRNDGLAVGQWLVTVSAELPSGNELSTQTSFNLR